MLHSLKVHFFFPSTGASLDVDIIAPSSSIPLPTPPSSSPPHLQIHCHREKAPRAEGPSAKTFLHPLQLRFQVLLTFLLLFVKVLTPTLSILLLRSLLFLIYLLPFISLLVLYPLFLFLGLMFRHWLPRDGKVQWMKRWRHCTKIVPRS